jgi:hypothetical protein
MLVGASTLGIAVVAITAGAPEPPPSERSVERRLRSLAEEGRFPLHEVLCERDEVLPRTFVCFVEGPDDLHLAWKVRWLHDGELSVRRPDGTPVRF